MTIRDGKVRSNLAEARHSHAKINMCLYPVRCSPLFGSVTYHALGADAWSVLPLQWRSQRQLRGRLMSCHHSGLLPLIVTMITRSRRIVELPIPSSVIGHLNELS